MIDVIVEILGFALSFVFGALLLWSLAMHQPGQPEDSYWNRSTDIKLFLILTLGSIGILLIGVFGVTLEATLLLLGSTVVFIIARGIVGLYRRFA